MKKLLIALMIATGLLFGSYTINQNKIGPSQVQAVEMYDSVRLFGEGTTIYKVPKYIGAGVKKWKGYNKAINPSLRIFVLSTDNQIEQWSYVLDLKKKQLLLGIYSRINQNGKTVKGSFLIWDGNAYPRTVDERTAQAYFSKKLKESGGAQL